MLDYNEIVDLRHILHQYPELSGQEKKTAQTILSFLSGYQPTKMISNLGGHGVAAVYQYADAGPTLLFRCELDALPIEENNASLSYRSMHKEISHKCGHDGHMAIVAGLAPIFAQKDYQKGKIILLFQPAEETGTGARSVLNDPRLTELAPSFVFALHNVPGFKKKLILLREGAFNAAVISASIKLYGKVSHAAEPENGINPAITIAKILQRVNDLNKPDVIRDDFTLITPVHIILGDKAYGTSPGYGEVHFTARCWTSNMLDSVMKDMEEIAKTISTQNNLSFSFERLEEFHGTYNNREMVEVIRTAAIHCGFETETRQIPFRWGEDFGLFTQMYPGAMFGIGSGENHPALHHDTYDFDDVLIAPGIEMFTAIADIILG